MRIILVSALLLLSAAFLVCQLLKKKEPRNYLIYQVGLVIISFAALLTDNAVSYTHLTLPTKLEV